MEERRWRRLRPRGATLPLLCGPTYAEHGADPSKTVRGSPPSSLVKRPSGAGAAGASCPGFAFVPSRPEEIGEHWLTRRRGFNVNTWRCKCQCGHTHEEHHPASRKCRACGCSAFRSNFLCVVCDKHWEDHETVFESESERKALGLPTGRHFMPLASTPDIRRAVFRGTKSMAATGAPPHGSLEERWQNGEISAQEYQRLILAEGENITSAADDARISSPTKGALRQQRRLTRAARRGPERSVRLSHVSSGGTARGRILNRWGKAAPARGTAGSGASS